jgi:hypothetical protein
MPPISMFPNGPWPIIIGMVLTGPLWPASVCSWCSAIPSRAMDEARQHIAHARLHARPIGAGRIGHDVAHGVHGVVGHVAVERPVARNRDELDVAHLADADEFGHLASGRGQLTRCLHAVELISCPCTYVFDFSIRPMFLTSARRACRRCTSYAAHLGNAAPRGVPSRKNRPFSTSG